MDYAKNKKYFQPVNLKLGIIVCIIGLILFAATPIAGIVGLAIGAFLIYLQVGGRPSDADIDAAVTSQLSNMKARALKKLGLDEDEVSEIAPISFDGYVYNKCTELIGNQYRGTYSFSYELSGAINQVLNYRDKLTKEYYSLCHQSSEPFEVLSPKCVVIIGKMASLTPGQVAAFENFRNSLSNVLILTFDELYQRIVDLIAVLSESPNQQPGIFEPETGNEDLPF